MKRRPWEAVRLSVPEGQRIGPCGRCGEAVVIERWRDYWRSGGRLTSGAYEVVEEHECEVLPRPVTPPRGRTA